jgi:hypothetical protein
MGVVTTQAFRANDSGFEESFGIAVARYGGLPSSQ